MSVTFYTGPDMSSREGRIEGPNIANITTRVVLTAMGIDAGEFLHGHAEPAEFIRGAILVRNTLRAESHVIEASDEGGPGTGHARVICGGLDAEAINYRVDLLDRLARDGQAKGYKVVWWG